MQPVVPPAENWPQSLPRYWPLEGLALVVTREGDFPVSRGAQQPGLQARGTPRSVPPRLLEAELLVRTGGEE